MNAKARLGSHFLALLFLGAWVAPLQASQSEPNVTLALVGGRLIDGYGGDPVEESIVLVAGDTILDVSRVGQLAVPENVEVVDTRGMTVLPGLWESHGHLMHVGAGDPAAYLSRFSDRMPAIMERVAEISLMAGITSFRDVGGPLDQQMKLREEIDAGRKPGPRLYLAGPIVTYRHANNTATPERDLEANVIREVGEHSVGTPQEARAVAEELVGLHVDQIKIFGFQNQSVLEPLVEAAHAAGIGIDADVRNVEAYRAAIGAGVDRLHHVFTADPLSDYGDDEMRTLIRGERPIAIGPWTSMVRGPYILPTIEMRQAYVRVHDFPGILEHPTLREQYTPDLYEFLFESWRRFPAIPWGRGARQRLDVVKQKLREFTEAGGREQLVAGCDTGSPLNFHSPLAREVANLVEAGLPPMEAIESATVRAAEMQGVDQKLGTVSPGKLADIIVVDGDPLQNIEVLERHVVHVIKNGVIYK